MKKIILSVLLVFCIVPVSLFAAESDDDMILVASWMWKTDPEIKRFRYKVNNNDPAFWDHVVNGDVTSYSIRGVKKGEVYTLYLQQSYDGVNWSETAVSTIEVN